MEVPELPPGRLPDPLSVEKMPTPGAVMSGFSQLSPYRGPPEVNDAKPEKFGFVTVVFVVVAY